MVWEEAMNLLPGKNKKISKKLTPIEQARLFAQASSKQNKTQAPKADEFSLTRPGVQRMGWGNRGSGY